MYKNLLRQTQLDSHYRLPISSDRFWLATNRNSVDLKDKWVWDVGCDAGRFAEVVLTAGAKLVALGYSGAVDARYPNLKYHPNLHMVCRVIFIRLPLCWALSRWFIPLWFCSIRRLPPKLLLLCRLWRGRVGICA
jgi:hypothetical protein